MLSVLRPIHLRVDPTANSQRLEESKFSETRGYRTTHGRVDASRCQCKRRREGSTAHRMTLCVPQRNQPPASRTARHVTSTFRTRLGAYATRTTTTGPNTCPLACILEFLSFFCLLSLVNFAPVFHELAILAVTDNVVLVLRAPVQSLDRGDSKPTSKTGMA